MSKVILSANTDWYLYNFRFSLIRFLRDHGYQVVLVSPPGSYTRRFAEEGLPWIPWRLGRQTLVPWREIPSLLQLARIYRREEPDLVHHHTIKPVLYGSLTARLLGMDNVVNSITGRGYVFLGRERKAHALRKTVKRLYRLALNHPNYAVIFENDTDQEYFIAENFVPRNRTWLISSVGVDPVRYTPSPEPEGPPVVLFSGRLLWDKGVGVLVEAARLLRQKTPLRVALVGKPDPGNPASIDEDTLNGWVQEGAVEWWGWQPDMSQVYRQCHIVAAPSMYGEGVPTVLLEAAASGRPVVSTDMPGCRDIAVHGCNGLVVPPNDPQALAEALHELAADPALRGRMGAAGRKLILEKFTTTQVNTATLEVYRKVLRRRSLAEVGNRTI